MNRMLNIQITKATIAITEKELLTLLEYDPILWATCLKRGKAINRAEQRRERITNKRQSGENP